MVSSRFQTPILFQYEGYAAALCQRYQRQRPLPVSSNGASFSAKHSSAISERHSTAECRSEKMKIINLCEKGVSVTYRLIFSFLLSHCVHFYKWSWHFFIASQFLINWNNWKVTFCSRVGSEIYIPPFLHHASFDTKKVPTVFSSNHFCDRYFSVVTFDKKLCFQGRQLHF